MPTTLILNLIRFVWFFSGIVFGSLITLVIFLWWLKKNGLSIRNGQIKCNHTLEPAMFFSFKEDIDLKEAERIMNETIERMGNRKC